MGRLISFKISFSHSIDMILKIIPCMSQFSALRYKHSWLKICICGFVTHVQVGLGSGWNVDIVVEVTTIVVYCSICEDFYGYLWIIKFSCYCSLIWSQIAIPTAVWGGGAKAKSIPKYSGCTAIADSRLVTGSSCYTATT